MSEEANKPDDSDVPPQGPVQYWPVYLGYPNADGPWRNDPPLNPAIQHLPGILLGLLGIAAVSFFAFSLYRHEWFIPLGLIVTHLPLYPAFQLSKRAWGSPETQMGRDRQYRYMDLTENLVLPETEDYSVGMELELNDRIQPLADSDTVEWNQFDNYQVLGTDGDAYVVRLSPRQIGAKSHRRPDPSDKPARPTGGRSLERLLWLLPTMGVATLFVVSLHSHGWHADTLTALMFLLIHLFYWLAIGLMFWGFARDVSYWWTHPKGDGSTYLLFDQRAISETETRALLDAHLPEFSEPADQTSS